MTRQATGTIKISDLWDGIDQDSELFIINGQIYQKLDLQTMLELSVHAMVIKVKPNADKKIIFTTKSDGLQLPYFDVVVDNSLKLQCTDNNHTYSYTYTDTNIKTLYFVGKIGFELDDTCVLDDVVQWGDSNKMVYFSKFFKYFNKKSILAYDLPDLTLVTSLYQTFYSSSLSFDMNVIDTTSIVNLNQAYQYSVAPNLGFVFPTFKNVANLDETFANITNAAINWSGLKFLKLTSSINTFKNSVIIGNIINCEFGSDVVSNIAYNAQKLFAYLNLDGNISYIKINSSYVESLFEGSIIGDLDIQTFTFRSLLNANKMFLSINTKELKLNNCFSFGSNAVSQYMFKNINISGVFIFQNFTFGSGQFCLEMFSEMQYSSALIYNINFNGAVMDGMFKEIVYNTVEKNIKVSSIDTSLCTSFISTFENNDNLLFHNPNLININMTKATTLNSLYKGCKLFNFKNFTCTTISFPEVVNAESMFEDCASMQADFTNLRLPKLKYANKMLKNCQVFDSPLNTLGCTLLEQADFMLENCSSFNSATVTSANIINAEGMMKNCSSFNQSLGFGFSTTAPLVKAKELLKGCISFNPATLITLNLSKCIDGSSIFEDCSVLNQSVTIICPIMINFNYMFKGTSIGTGKTITLTSINTTTDITMIGIFASTNSFGATLTGFNTIKVIDFSHLCDSSYNFTSDIAELDLQNCLNLSYAFSNSNYNIATGTGVGIGNWNVSKVTNFFACFENSEFNQVLNWTTTAGEIYSYMFRNNKIFNQPLTNFNFASAITTEKMFLGSEAFNQDLSTKRFNKCMNFDFMFYNALAYANRIMSLWLVDSIKTGISHIGFLKTPNGNTEPVWK